MLACVFACGRGSASDGGEESSEASSSEASSTMGEGSASAESSEGSSDGGSSDTGTGGSCGMPCLPDNEGHACCESLMGPGFFCGEGGACIPSSGCEALDCCTPGETGDAYCQTNFGGNSSCVEINGDGRCRESGDCSDLDVAECHADENCMPVDMVLMTPGPDALWCVGDVFEYMGCIEDQGCDDAESFWCDAQGQVYWAPSGCGVESLDQCMAPGDYEFCGG